MDDQRKEEFLTNAALGTDLSRPMWQRPAMDRKSGAAAWPWCCPSLQSGLDYGHERDARTPPHRPEIETPLAHI